MISLLLASLFTLIELNCENLFDTRHDSLKNDTEFLPEGSHHWTRTRYWHKLNDIGREIIALGDDSAGWRLPDVVAMCEVENDSVMYDLTKRSLLRKARYEYLMTDSPDERGIDVALMYNPVTFRPLSHHAIRIPLLPDMRPTRDILYVAGLAGETDTLHLFVVHAPSRMGGERASRPFRLQVTRLLIAAIDSIRTISREAHIILAGDFNDYADSPALDSLYIHDMHNVSATARGANGARGTYRFRGEWGSLDQIICSLSVAGKLANCHIGDLPFLLEEDEKYGGVHPRRTYLGPKYQRGFSDHLPLVARFKL